MLTSIITDLLFGMNLATSQLFSELHAPAVLGSY